MTIERNETQVIAETIEASKVVVLGQAVPTSDAAGLTLGFDGGNCDDYEKICWAQEG